MEGKKKQEQETWWKMDKFWINDVFPVSNEKENVFTEVF